MCPIGWPVLTLLVLSACSFGNVDPLPEGVCLQIENRHAVIALTFSPNGKTLAVCCDDDTIRCWDVGTGNPGRCLPLISERSRERRLHCNFISPQLEFAAGGKTLCAAFPVSASVKGNLTCFDLIKQWDLSTGKQLREVRGEKDESLNVVRDISGTLMGVRIGKDRVRCWDLTTGKECFTWPMRKTIHENKTSWMFKGFSADAQVLVTATPLARSFHGWGIDLACHEAFQGGILCDIDDSEIAIDSPLALSPNGRTIAVSTRISGKIQLRQTHTGQSLYPEEISPQRFRSLNRRSASRVVPALKGEITCMTFSPDAKTLAIAGQRGTICLWETATAKERRRFIGQQGPIQALAFSADGRLLAAGGRDGIVYLWSVKPSALPQQPSEAKLTPEQMQTLWDRLAGKDAVDAYRAIHQMRSARQQGVSFLKQRLPQLTDADYRRIQRLLVDLDSDQYTVRAAADEELRKWGVAALPLLSRVLDKKPSLEVRRRVESIVEDIRTSQAKSLAAERIRYGRAVEVLEHSGTAGTKELLRLLSERAADPYLRQEAQEASQRLANSAIKAGRLP